MAPSVWRRVWRGDLSRGRLYEPHQTSTRPPRLLDPHGFIYRIPVIWRSRPVSLPRYGPDSRSGFAGGFSHGIRRLSDKRANGRSRFAPIWGGSCNYWLLDPGGIQSRARPESRTGERPDRWRACRPPATHGLSVARSGFGDSPPPSAPGPLCLFKTIYRAHCIRLCLFKTTPPPNPNPPRPAYSLRYGNYITRLTLGAGVGIGYVASKYAIAFAKFNQRARERCWVLANTPCSCAALHAVSWPPTFPACHLKLNTRQRITSARVDFIYFLR